MASDRILLNGIQVQARHGVYAEEKLADQLFVIDLDCRLRRLEGGDDLATTVDYAVLARDVAAAAAVDGLDLIETLAERVARVCLDRPLIRKVVVTVHKPQADLGVEGAAVAVRITRARG